MLNKLYNPGGGADSLGVWLPMTSLPGASFACEACLLQWDGLLSGLSLPCEDRTVCSQPAVGRRSWLASEGAGALGAPRLTQAPLSFSQTPPSVHSLFRGTHGWI